MLKITIQPDRDTGIIVLEGKLAGAWIEEARQAWQALPKAHGVPLVIDLTGVTYVDAGGKALLAAMWREGADLRAAGCCTRFIVDEIIAGQREPA